MPVTKYFEGSCSPLHATQFTVKVNTVKGKRLPNRVKPCLATEPPVCPSPKTILVCKKSLMIKGRAIET